MLDFSGSTTVYLACGVTDLRKSYTGLAAIIKLKFQDLSDIVTSFVENFINIS